MEIQTVGIIEEGPRPKGNYLPRQRILKAEVSRAISTIGNQHPWYVEERSGATYSLKQQPSMELSKKIKVFDSFAGVGGFAVGLHNALGDEEIVGFSEYDKHASAVLAHRYPTVRNYGDITKIDWSTVPDFDLFTGGSPCQSFSLAGDRKGMDGSSGLVLEYFRALREKRPKFFVHENVPGMLSIDGGQTLLNIYREFTACGYALNFDLINAKEQGVPQSRNRVYTIGIRCDLLPDDFPDMDAPTGNKARDKAMKAVLADPLIRTFKFSFPASVPLTVKLRDILEKTVDDKFYLRQEMADKLLSKMAAKHAPGQDERIEKGDTCSAIGAAAGANKKKIMETADKDSFPTLDSSYYKGVNPEGGTQASTRAVIETVAQHRSDAAVQQVDQAPDLKASGGTDPTKIPFVVSYGEAREMGDHSNAIEATYHKGHDNRGARTMVAESANIVSRGMETRDDGVAYAVKAADGGSSKPHVVVQETANSLKARADSGIDDKHPQTIIVEPPRNGSSGSESEDHAPSLRSATAENVRVMQLDGGNEVRTVERFPLKFADRNQKNVDGDHAYTVDTAQTGGVREPDGMKWRVRKLTPVETCRLQAFPDQWNEYGNYGDGKGPKLISATQRYRQMGNAITTRVFEVVARKFFAEFGRLL